MTGMEHMASVLDEWAEAVGVAPLRLDADGNVTLPLASGETILGVRGGDVYVTADAGDAAACAYPDMLVCRLMEANGLWADSFGFTYALDGRNHVVLQDRREAAFFTDETQFANYVMAIVRTVRSLRRGDGGDDIALGQFVIIIP